MQLSFSILLSTLCTTCISAIFVISDSLRTEGLHQLNGISTTTPRLTWLLSSSTRGDLQSAYQVQVATSTSKFTEADLWDSGKISSASNSVYYAGAELKSRTIAWWRVLVYDINGVASPWSSTGKFEMGLLNSSDWTASWIGNTAYVSGTNSLPVFAKNFSVSCPTTQSRLYLLGLGAHSATLNGAAVDSSVLDPGYSTFAKTLYYSTYDVSTLLTQGTNLLGVELGKGIYDPEPGLNGRYMKFTDTPKQLMLIAQLEYTCSDGTVVTVASDTTWSTTVNGPRIESSWFGGEEYDARQEIPGWPSKVTSYTGWAAANRTEIPTGTLIGTPKQSLQVFETITPISVTKVSGLWVFDFGVNFAGWFQLTVNETRGTRVVAYPSERLTSGGLADQSTTGSPIFDGFTSNGTVATFSPKFMYHGFRYLQVNLTSTPSTSSASGLSIRSSVDTVGSLSSSHTLFNNIHTIIDRSIQSNMYSSMTDCPHREKLGWLEESHLVIDPVIFTYDMEATLRKIAKDMVDSQISTGLVADISPEFTVFSGGFRDDPNWGNAVVLLPLQHYQAYGDISVLADTYSAMQAYVAYLENKAGSTYLLNYGLGDWETLDSTTSAGITATYGFSQAVQGMISIAGYLGKANDVAKYTALAGNIINAFNAAYFNPTSMQYGGGQQAALALALDMGAANSTETYKSIAASLVSNVATTGYWTTGEISLPSLFRVLMNSSSNELLYKLMSSTSYPSYGYEVAQGATSLWEQFNGNSADSSLNHFMFGYGDIWLRRLSGLSQSPGSVGWANITYSPITVGDLTTASATYRSFRGIASATWKLDSALTYEIVVPVGSTGTVVLNSTTVLESGSDMVAGSNGIESFATENNTTTIRVGSGSYNFTAH
ncbi:glycoside hydrolase family 78 protein [Hyaloscypha variabilis]